MRIWLIAWRVMAVCSETVFARPVAKRSWRRLAADHDLSRDLLSRAESPPRLMGRKYPYMAGNRPINLREVVL